MNDETQELLKLVKENPDLPIIPIVYYEVCGDDYGYWMGKFDYCRVDEYCYYNDKYFDDAEELKEEYYNCNEEIYLNMSNEEIEKDLEEITKNMWQKAIIVYIKSPK